ncbi:MAG: VOC family protein [Myxococcales bacterium]|nr:VOC family protein [Myxococcales bacterium]
MANPLCHWELAVSDVARTKRFYSAVFDWTFEPMGPEYTMIETGSGPRGGLMEKPPRAPAPALNTYFQVADLAKTLRLAVEAGATVVVPKTEITGAGWFAMFLDPDRIPVGIFEEVTRN